MKQKSQTVRHFFEAGYKIQLKPDERLIGVALIGRYLDGLHATITRVELFPDPKGFELETQEDWDSYRSIRSVHFWVKLDDFSELDNYYKHNEVQFRYCELQPLPPRMTEAQLAQYCKQCFVKERNEQRGKAYFQVMCYLDGKRPSYPLSFVPIIPSGHSVDLINQLVSWGTCMRQKAWEIRESWPTQADEYETQAQIYDALRDRLLPQQSGTRANVRLASPVAKLT